jgi:hypothetical protein
MLTGVFMLPPSFRRLGVYMLLAWAASTLSACSFIEHWDTDGLACDSRVVDGNTNFCLQGFTCFNPTVTCVRDHSRSQGQACTDARQCHLDQVCPLDLVDGSGVAQQDDVQTCLQQCDIGLPDKGFFQPDACPLLHYCSPFLDAPFQSSYAQLVGGCVETDGCAPLTNCNIDNKPGGTCVPLSATTNACLTSCNISWTTTAAYNDNCGSDHYCQPIGLAPQQQFVCLNNAHNAVARGQACTPVATPCAKGDVCSPEGICAQYCELTNNISQLNCPQGQNCCSFNSFSGAQASGFCSTRCP